MVGSRDRNMASMRPIRRDLEAQPSLIGLGIAVVRLVFVAGGNNSVVECDLAKVEVAGSNPVSRSNFLSLMTNLTGRRARCCRRA